MLHENVNKEISFDDLPNYLLVLLTEKFNKLLFQKLIKILKGSEKARKFIGCSNGSFYNYINRTDFIPVNVIRKIKKLCEIKSTELNKNILQIKRMNGTPFPIKLPLNVDVIVANLVGHLFGDGHIDASGRVSYVNKNKKLIKNFQSKMKQKFNVNPATIRNKGKDDNSVEIRYCSPIGDLFLILGCIMGRKIQKKFDVPNWIMKSNKEIKSAYLRALFDDESTVSKGKSIRISLSKTNSENGLLFFDSLKKILKDLEIETNPVLRYVYKTPRLGRNRVKYELFITSRKNLENYKKMIDFEHLDKSKKLSLQIGSYKY